MMRIISVITVIIIIIYKIYTAPYIIGKEITLRRFTNTIRCITFYLNKAHKCTLVYI